MSEEAKKTVEGIAQGLNQIPEGARGQAVKLAEAYASGLAAGVALAAEAEVRNAKPEA